MPRGKNYVGICSDFFEYGNGMVVNETLCLFLNLCSYRFNNISTLTLTLVDKVDAAATWNPSAWLFLFFFQSWRSLIIGRIRVIKGQPNSGHCFNIFTINLQDMNLLFHFSVFFYFLFRRVRRCLEGKKFTQKKFKENKQ